MEEMRMLVSCSSSRHKTQEDKTGSKKPQPSLTLPQTRRHQLISGPGVAPPTTQETRSHFGHYSRTQIDIIFTLAVFPIFEYCLKDVPNV